MPPKVKYGREDIVGAAYEIVRERGILALNARDVARRLTCSTQPVFHWFRDMDELKAEVYGRAEAAYSTALFRGAEHPIPFLGIGLAYIRFADREPHLFHLLFLSGYHRATSLMQMVEGEDNEPIIAMVGQMTGLDQERAKSLFLKIWLTVHGIAALCATGACDLQEGEIAGILTDVFEGCHKNLLGKGNQSHEG